MKVKLLFSLWVVAVAWVTAHPAFACPSLSKARSLYLDGKIDEALTALHCLEKGYPRDLDVKRLISDIYWWQGNVDASLAVAAEGEKLNPWLEDPDTAIHLAERLRPWRLTASIDEIWGDQQSGTEYFGLLDYRFEGRDHISAGFSRVARNYSGGQSYDDRIFRAGYVRLQGKRSYIDTEVTYSPDHAFSAEYSAGVEPHYVLVDDSDVSLLLEYLHYTEQNAVLVSPGWRHIFGLWTFQANLKFLVSDDVLPSVQLSAGYFLSPKTQVSASFGFGRALEGPGLEDSFDAAGGALTQYIDPSLALNLRGSIYRADLYSENRIALGADWFF